MRETVVDWVVEFIRNGKPFVISATEIEGANEWMKKAWEEWTPDLPPPRMHVSLCPWLKDPWNIVSDGWEIFGPWRSDRTWEDW